jgi:hypothetical protein
MYKKGAVVESVTVESQQDFRLEVLSKVSLTRTRNNSYIDIS